MIASHKVAKTKKLYKPGIELAPGGGVFLLNPDTNPFTITFVGEVQTGDLSNPIPAGLSIRSSIVPQGGGLTTDLGYAPEDGDQCYQYDSSTGQYVIRTYDGLFTMAWDTEPNLAVGESFFLSSQSAKDWVRTFNP